MKAKRQVFFLDGEPGVHRTAEKIFGQLGEQVAITCFGKGTRCLEEMRRTACDVLITELNLPDMDGHELLVAARLIIPFLPVIAITSRSNITGAVKAMKTGASDVVVKPLQQEEFLSAVEDALSQVTLPNGSGVESLSKAERKVLMLILEGKSNKQIALCLHRSVRTIEDHRSHIIHKFGVDNLVELTKRAAGMGLVRLP